MFRAKEEYRELFKNKLLPTCIGHERTKADPTKLKRSNILDRTQTHEAKSPRKNVKVDTVKSHTPPLVSKNDSKPKSTVKSNEKTLSYKIGGPSKPTFSPNKGRSKVELNSKSKNDINIPVVGKVVKNKPNSRTSKLSDCKICLSRFHAGDSTGATTPCNNIHLRCYCMQPILVNEPICKRLEYSSPCFCSTACSLIEGRREPIKPKMAISPLESLNTASSHRFKEREAPRLLKRNALSKPLKKIVPSLHKFKCDHSATPRSMGSKKSSSNHEILTVESYVHKDNCDTPWRGVFKPRCCVIRLNKSLFKPSNYPYVSEIKYQTKESMQGVKEVSITLKKNSISDKSCPDGSTDNCSCNTQSASFQMNTDAAEPKNSFASTDNHQEKPNTSKPPDRPKDDTQKLDLDHTKTLPDISKHVNERSQKKPVKRFTKKRKTENAGLFAKKSTESPFLTARQRNSVFVNKNRNRLASIKSLKCPNFSKASLRPLKASADISDNCETTDINTARFPKLCDNKFLTKHMLPKIEFDKLTLPENSANTLNADNCKLLETCEEETTSIQKATQTEKCEIDNCPLRHNINSCNQNKNPEEIIESKDDEKDKKIVATPLSLKTDNEKLHLVTCMNVIKPESGHRSNEILNKMNFNLIELPAHLLVKTKLISMNELHALTNPIKVPDIQSVCSEIYELLFKHLNNFKYISASEKQNRIEKIMKNTSFSIEDAKSALRFLNFLLFYEKCNSASNPDSRQLTSACDSSLDAIDSNESSSKTRICSTCGLSRGNLHEIIYKGRSMEFPLKKNLNFNRIDTDFLPRESCMN